MGGALSGMRSSRAEKGNANWVCCRSRTRCRLAALHARTEANGVGSLISNLAAVGDSGAVGVVVTMTLGSVDRESCPGVGIVSVVFRMGN